MMEINIKPDGLARICEQLRSGHRPGRKDGLRTAHLDVLRDGWGMRYDFQDILWETDDRADVLARHKDDFDCLLKPYNLNWVSRFRRPLATAKEAWGSPAMRVEDLAVWIMEVERLGFSVDAEPLVTALRPPHLEADARHPQ